MKPLVLYRYRLQVDFIFYSIFEIQLNSHRIIEPEKRSFESLSVSQTSLFKYFLDSFKYLKQLLKND